MVPFARASHSGVPIFDPHPNHYMVLSRPFESLDYDAPALCIQAESTVPTRLLVSLSQKGPGRFSGDRLAPSFRPSARFMTAMDDAAVKAEEEALNRTYALLEAGKVGHREGAFATFEETSTKQEPKCLATAWGSVVTSHAISRTIEMRLRLFFGQSRN